MRDLKQKKNKPETTKLDTNKKKTNLGYIIEKQPDIHMVVDVNVFGKNFNKQISILHTQIIDTNKVYR